MKADWPVVVFGEEWGLHSSSTQHLASRLGEIQPVLYVNAVGLRRPRLNIHDVRRAFGKLEQWMRPKVNGCQNGLLNMPVYSPVRVPLNTVASVRRWNKHNLVKGLHHELTRHRMEAPVLFVSSPVGAEAVGSVGERLLVYYITDDYPALPGVDRSYVEDLEAVLLSEADLIFATSTELQRKKRGAKTETLLLPHGVDFEHFHAASDPLGPMPEELRHLPRPLLGFYGLLAPWVDADLLTDVARAFPGASVVMIGQAWSGWQQPTGVPNLHWLGPRTYADLPKYAAHFDVGLITFKQNRLTASVNPLKLLEYFALGLPVVSTPLPDLGLISRAVFQARNSSEFISQVEAALAERDPARRQERFALAAQESWDTRLGNIVEEIGARLG
jgi:glycosyltransferase involved in cell wall biosynthesis